MAEQVYLAIDLGAESGRVMAGQFDGTKLTLEELHRFSNGPVHVAGTLRWNIVGLWSNILDGLRKAHARFGDSICSIGVDTWGVDYCLLSKSGELLGLPFHYRDDRTQGVVDQTLTQVSRSEVFEQTGLQFICINTLYQLVAMRRDHPEMLDQAATFLMMPDMINWLLCGSRVVEFTNATTTQFFHPVQRDWSYDLLKKLDLPTEMLPQTVNPGTELGNIRSEVATTTGLGRVPVIAPATHDTGAAVAAVPTKLTGHPNWAYISSGTWSLIGLEVANAIITPDALKWNVTNEGGVDGTYRLLKNVMGLWLVQQSRRAFARQGRDYDYSQMARLAEEAAPFGAVVDPDDEAFLSPDDMTEAIRTNCRQSGQAVPDSDGAVLRTCLESLALKYRVVLGWLEELTGTPVEVIHIVGGGTQNRLLNQLTADACNRPVVTGPIEATAMGNLLLQARGRGALGSLADLREVVMASSEIERFEPSGDARWQDAAGRFESIMRSGGASS